MSFAGLARTCALIAIVPFAVIAADHHCDLNLAAQADSPYGYKLRGDRCEGLYINPVAGTTLRLASLTEAFDEYHLDPNQPIRLQWDGGLKHAGEVHVRAQSLQRRQYYRMDAALPANAKDFRWPTDILSALSIAKPDLGVLAFTRESQDDAAQAVYLPLRVSQGAEPSKTGSYRAVVLPGAELTEVFVSLSIVESNGRRRMLTDGQPLKYGYYPAERAISFPVPNTGEAGLHILQVGATLRNGGVANLEFSFWESRR